MKYLIAGFALVALVASSPVIAGPRGYGPAEAANNWSGYYAGISGGGAWYNDGSIVGSSNVNSVVAAYNAANPQSPPGTVVPITTVGKKSSGFSAGGLVGYNYQSGMLVMGGEADFNFINVKSERSGNGSTSCCNGATAYFAIDAVNKIDWYGTARARVGLAPFQTILLYATGGLAYGDVAISNSNMDTYSTNTIPSRNWFGSHSQLLVGWAGGAGVQYALTDRTSLGVEYLYVDLGHSSVTATYQGPAVSAESSQIYYAISRANRFSVVRAALSYKF